MSNINDVLDAVTADQKATGQWLLVEHENGLLKLTSKNGDMDMRVDATPTQANIFTVEYNQAEHEWVYLNVQDINDGINRMVAEIKAG